MNIEELKRLAEAATPGPWYSVQEECRVGEVCSVNQGGQPWFQIYCDNFHPSNNESDAAYITAANPAAILELIQQRDELLASLKEARELVEDWGAYAPAYMQEKHDLEGDLSRLDAVISKMETP